MNSNDDAKRRSKRVSRVLDRVWRECELRNSSLGTSVVFDAGNLTGGAAYDSAFFIDGFKKLADDERDRLDTLDFFLGTEEFSAKVVRFIPDVILHISCDYNKAAVIQQKSEQNCIHLLELKKLFVRFEAFPRAV